MEHSSSRVWFITGSSSGFGRAITEAALADGDRVVATARRPHQLDDLIKRYPETLLTLPLDVTQHDQIRTSLQDAVQYYGRLDVLVNNAGYGLIGALEECSEAEVRQQLETNLFGAIHLTQAALPILRQQRSGHIIQISSLGGIVGTGFSGFSLYCASKFALEGLSEVLADEVAPLGIHVTLIEPGLFRTDFCGRSLVTAHSRIAEYNQTSGATQAWISQVQGNEPGNPIQAAQAILQAVHAPQPPLRLALGTDAVQSIRGKLAAMERELQNWEQISCTTDFEPAQISRVWAGESELLS